MVSVPEKGNLVNQGNIVCVNRKNALKGTFVLKVAIVVTSNLILVDVEDVDLTVEPSGHLNAANVQLARDLIWKRLLIKI
jgi:hypothetical protein